MLRSLRITLVYFSNLDFLGTGCFHRWSKFYSLGNLEQLCLHENKWVVSWEFSWQASLGNYHWSQVLERVSIYPLEEECQGKNMPESGEECLYFFPTSRFSWDVVVFPSSSVVLHCVITTTELANVLVILNITCRAQYFSCEK